MDVCPVGLSVFELGCLRAALSRDRATPLPMLTSETLAARLADPRPAIFVCGGNLDAAARSVLPRQPGRHWVLSLQAALPALPAWADDVLGAPFTEERLATRLEVGRRALAVRRGPELSAAPTPAGLSPELSPVHHAALLEQAATVAAAGDGQEALVRVLGRVAEAMNVERVSLWRFRDLPRRAECSLVYHRSVDRAEPGPSLRSDDHPAYYAALESRRLLASADVRTDPNTRGFAEAYFLPHGITSVINAPVFTGGTLAGVVCIAHAGEPRTWSDTELRFAVSAAQLVSLMLEIGERRRIEQNLAEAERRFGQLVENTRDLVWSVAADGTLTYVNDPAATRLFGAPAAEMIGRPFVDAGGSTHRHTLLTWMVRLLNGESPAPLELVHRRPDDQRVPLRFVGAALHDDRGNVSGATGTATEVTGLVRSTDNVGRFRPLLDNAAEAIFVVSVEDAVVVDANQTAHAWLANPGERLTGRSVFSLGILEARDLEAWFAVIAQLEANPPTPPLPVTWLTRPDGMSRAAEVSVTLHPVDGEDLAVVVLRDVTERRRREVELQLFRFAVDSAAEGMFRVDRTGRILDCNVTACERLGYSSAELHQLHVWDFEETLTAESWPAYWNAMVASGRRVVKSWHQRKDATWVPVEVSLAMFTYEGVQYMCAFVRDIAAQLEAERAIRRRDERLRAVIASIPGVVYQYRLNAEGLPVFSFLSERARDVLQIDPTPGVAMPIPFERIVAEDRRAVLNSISRIQASPGPWDAEFRFRLRDGTTTWIRGESRPDVDPDDGTLVWNGLFTDIAARKHLESKLQLTSNLAAVGTLAAGVAHEINNPLSYMVGNVSYALETLSGAAGRPHPGEAESADLVRALGEAMDGGRRVAAIVADLKTFSRADDRPAQPMALNPVLDVALRMTANQLRYRTRFEIDRGPSPIVYGQEGRLAQVFINLLMNAVESFPPERDPAENLVRVQIRVQGERVEIEISDNGEGMPREVLTRAFDPFFTTKAPGVGTGLGLSVVHGIVEALGGEISVESEVGQGTRFVVSLRVADRLPTGSTPIVDPGAVAVRRRVLFVDDDPMVLKAAARLLAREHDLTTVTRGAEALERLRAGERYDLIISDVMMPDLTGADFHAAVAQEMPELLPRLYLMTGGAFTQAMQQFAEVVGDRLLDKARDLPRLRELVRTLT